MFNSITEKKGRNETTTGSLTALSSILIVEVTQTHQTIQAFIDVVNIYELTEDTYEAIKKYFIIQEM